LAAEAVIHHSTSARRHDRQPVSGYCELRPYVGREARVPSSVLFAGLAAIWLAVLVPMAARRRQPTPRPSDAVLSCRVLPRPRRRDREVSGVAGPTDDGDRAADRASATPRGRSAGDPREDNREPYAEHGRRDADQGRRDADHGRRNADQGRRDDGRDYPYDHRDDLDEPDLSRRRFRPGRGGYDPEVAALAARARYTFRQRMVFALVLLAIASGLVAWGLGLPAEWWVHGGVDLCLVGYLVYLRRQVRLEQAIRSRRAARLAGHGTGRAGEQWDRGGNRYADPDDAAGTAEPARIRIGRRRGDALRTPGRDIEPGAPRRDAGPGAARRAPGPGCPGLGPGRNGIESADEPPALPRLRPSPPPVQPRGTVLLELDAEDPELHELEYHVPHGYRRAAGQ
jgi:hypothetical protein